MKHNKAFSLLELSIALAIIGLIAGGIVAGTSMIRAAEVRTITTDWAQYQTAITSFKTKYNELPGDMSNAGRIWGYPAGNPAKCPATAGTGTETCNGNGDGSIEVGTPAGNYGEAYMFWQHLVNSGMISGEYTGRSTAAGVGTSIAGINVPSSKITDSGWSTVTFNFSPGGPENFSYQYRNWITFGAQSQARKYPDGPLLTPTEVWKIDKKIDDGRPGQGNVLPVHWDECTDAASHGGIVASDRDNSNYLSLLSLNWLTI